MNALGVRPSFATGFAQGPGESEYPELWRGLMAAYDPSLGQTGGRLIDWSGRGNHGPLGGNVAWTSGPLGPALDFPGDAGDSIEPGVILFDCSKPFAVSVRINPDTSGVGQDAIWSKYGGASQGVIFRRNTDTTLDIWLSNAVTQLNTTVNNGTWYHVFVTYDGTKTYVYVNAVLDSAFPVTRPLTDLSRLFQIGESSLGHYDGQLDNLIIWQRYFSASEISLLHQLRKQVA